MDPSPDAPALPLPAGEEVSMESLRGLTPARIHLGRAGGSLPVRRLLEFRRDHAAARDAVHAPFDAARLAGEVRVLFPRVIPVATMATDRATYLMRPDAGRQISPEGARDLHAQARPDGWDLVIILSDGLSATAMHRQAVPFLRAFLPMLAEWAVAPVVVAPFGRVGLQDAVGHAIGARFAVTLLGERPGLGSADSMGAYFVHAPGPGRSDADRNCLSNIRPEGLPPESAAAILYHQITRARALGGSGVWLSGELARVAGSITR